MAFHHPRSGRRQDASERASALAVGRLPAGLSAEGGAKLDALRRRIARIEGVEPYRLGGEQKAGAGQEGRIVPARIAGRLSLGVASADRALSGGLPSCGLTELRIEETRDTGAGTGFALALAALFGASLARPALWIGEATAYHEAGFFDRSGLAGFGLDPGAFLFVRTRRLAEAVWAGEEAARSGALSLVVLEARGNPKPLALQGTRRLHLRARDHGVPILLLRQAGEAEPTAAPFRLKIAPSRAGPVTDLIGSVRLLGLPAFAIAVEKSRDGRASHFFLEWNPDEHRFQSRSVAVPGALPDADVDRPDPARDMGTVVALRRAS